MKNGRRKLAVSGVSHAVGREARDTYDEGMAGVRYMDEKVEVSPYDEDGKLLFGVMPGPPPDEFGASGHPICYNVRLNLTTDPAHRPPGRKRRSRSVTRSTGNTATTPTECCGS